MMRLSIRRELYKLRELMDFMLDGAGVTPRGEHGELMCFFCKKRLHESDFKKHGNATGPAFDTSISIHHLNGDHDDNAHNNKAASHTTCHKSYHRRMANLARARKS